jgi:hypothetical protein
LRLSLLPGEPIPFIGRPALTCSQIIGDPKAQPSMCCGRPVHWRKVYGEMSASSYCEEHFKRNTVARTASRSWPCV